MNFLFVLINNMYKQIFSSKPMIILELGIIIFFGFHVAKQIIEKRAIEDEVSRLEAEISKLENKSDDLSALIEYAKTDTFIEQEAREKLNLVKDGESLVFIPNVDADLDSDPKVLSESSSSNENSLFSNINLWQKYFFDYNQLWMD